MFAYTSRRSTNKNKGLQIHSAIREFRKFEQQKKMLQNRINIMNSNQIKNSNKIKSLQEHFERMKKVQQIRRKEKQTKDKQISLCLQQNSERNKSVVRRIKEQKKNIENSIRLCNQFKLKNYQRAQSESRINCKKIIENKQNQMKQKRRKIDQINLLQELGRTKVQKFKTNKLISAKQESAQKLRDQLQLNNSTEIELKMLRKLQKQMVMKYSQSINSLRSSRTSMKNKSMIRA